MAVCPSITFKLSKSLRIKLERLQRKADKIMKMMKRLKKKYGIVWDGKDWRKEG